MALERFGYRFEFDTGDAEKAAKRLEEAEKSLAAEMIQSREEAKKKAESLKLTTSEYAQLQKRLGSVTEAVKDNAKATSLNKAQILSLKDAVFDAGNSIASGQNPFKSIALQAPQAFEALTSTEQGTALLTRALTSLAPYAVAASVAIYAISVALHAANREMEENTARYEAAEATLKAVQPVYDQLHQSKIDLKVATGELTKAEGEDLAIRERWNATTSKSIDLLRQQQAQLAEKTKPGIIDTSLAFFGLKDAADAYAETMNDTLGWAAPLAALWVEDANAAKQAKTQVAGLEVQIGNVNKAGQKGIETDEKGARAKTDHTAAVKAHKDAIDALNDGLRKILALDKDYRDTQASVRKVIEESTAAQLTGVAKVSAAEQAKQAELERLHTRQFADARGNLDRQLQADLDYAVASRAVTERAETEKAKIRKDAAIKAATLVAGYTDDEKSKYLRLKLDKEKLLAEYVEAAREAGRSEAEIAAVSANIEISYAKKVAEERKKEFQKAASEISQVGGYVQQGLGLVSSALDDAYEHSSDVASRLETQLAASEKYLTDNQKEALEERVKAAKDAAKKQFNAAKAVKIAESIASTALAAINAISESPPPSPFGIAGAAIAVAAGTAATAAIASTQPSFDDTPGVMQARPDPGERAVTVSLAPGDLFAAAKTPDALREQVGGGPGTLVVETRWKHQVIDRTVSETVKRGGRLRSEITGSTNPTPTGHRRR